MRLFPMNIYFFCIIFSLVQLLSSHLTMTTSDGMSEAIMLNSVWSNRLALSSLSGAPRQQPMMIVLYCHLISQQYMHACKLSAWEFATPKV